MSAISLSSSFNSFSLPGSPSSAKSGACLLEDLKLEKGLLNDSDAFREIANYSQVGRETERLMTFKFKHKPRGRPKKKGFFY